MSKALDKLSQLAESNHVQVTTRKMLPFEKYFRRYVFQWKLRVRHDTFADALRDGELMRLRDNLIASFTASLDAAIKAETEHDAPATQTPAP